MAGWGAHIAGVGNVRRTLNRVQARLDDTTVYAVGTPVKYGFWLEKGTKRMRPYPWFEPAIEEYKRNPQAFVRKNTEVSLDSLDSLGDAVATVAFALERQMKQNVKAQAASGRSPGTHPDHPRRVSTNLAGSIKAERIR